MGRTKRPDTRLLYEDGDEGGGDHFVVCVYFKGDGKGCKEN